MPPAAAEYTGQAQCGVPRDLHSPGTRREEGDTNPVRRNALNYWIDLAMFLLMIGIAFIGILLGFVIPKGERFSDKAKSFWGIGRHDWGDIHLWLSLTFVVLLIVHLWLHWGWIVATTKQVFRPKRPS